MVGVANDTTIFYTKAMKSWIMKIAINMNGRHKFFLLQTLNFCNANMAHPSPTIYG
jgi:hypothetical protein